MFFFQQKLTDDYFYESAEKISFFFEGIVLLIVWGKQAYLVLCFAFVFIKMN